MTAPHKFSIVLNKKVEMGRILNTVAHMSAALTAVATEEQRKHMLFLDYPDADGNKHPVSGLSLVVLRADNSNQIKAAREKAIADGLLHADFVVTMTEGTYQEQMERTSKLPENELDYWGLALFGESAKVNEITRKFSLYR